MVLINGKPIVDYLFEIAPWDVLNPEHKIRKKDIKKINDFTTEFRRVHNINIKFKP